MSFFKNITPVLVGTAILSIIAFINGYPLVYSDTGTYVVSGWMLEVPIDRPIAYGLFIRLFASISLWPVVIVQNLLTSFILYETFLFFFQPDKKTNFYFYSTICFLTVATGIGWYSNQIMPDFLTPLMILSIFILFFKKNMGTLKFIFISIILVFTIITHFSHLLMASSMAIIILLSNFVFFKKRLIKHNLQISLKKALLVSLIACSGWIVLPTVNKMISGEFYNSKSSHVFFMASMAEKGILQKFLKDKCNKPTYSDCKLCLYKNKIPTEVAAFIWDGRDSSVFNLTGGWYNSKAEYDKIIRATLIDPKYSSQHIYKSVVYGFTQLFENTIGHGLGAYREDSSPYWVVRDRYNIEFNMYMNSKQIKYGGAGLNMALINNINMLLLMLSLIFLICIYFSPAKANYNRTTVLFLSVMLLGIVLNSFITAGLSAPYGRYQTRVVWLMEFALIIFVLINGRVIKESVKNIFKKEENELP